MSFEVLKGKTIAAIVGGVGDDEMLFQCTDGSTYKMYHEQSCCESVSVEDIVGDLNDLTDSEVLEAEVVSNADTPEGVEAPSAESFTWTFYKLGTRKGSVTIRWFGSSNGYYGEGVSFEEVKS